MTKNLKKVLFLSLIITIIVIINVSVFATDTTGLSSLEESEIYLNVMPESYRHIEIEDRKNMDIAVPEDLISDTKQEQSNFSTRSSMPTGGGEYDYIPSYWNSSNIIYRSNCYGYMWNRISYDEPPYGYVFQPGYRTGDYYTSLTVSAIVNAVSSDAASLGATFRSSSYWEVPGSNEYKVALVIAPGVDYHWYRQNSSGTWSHKPGLTEITNRDASDNIIYDPQSADRNYSYANYSLWGGYFIVSRTPN